MTPALLEILKLDTWKLGLAAWIFAGYSPLQLKENGRLIRLADGQEIAHGSSDFGYAQKLQHKILSRLADHYQQITGGCVDPKKDQFLRNQIINEVINNWDAATKVESELRGIWWLDKAIEEHYVPAYINPDAVSPSMLEFRGYTTYRKPGSNQEQSIGSAEVITSDTTTEEVVGTLFRKSAKPQSEFYVWLQDFVVDEFLHAEPPEQIKISGCDKHSHPLPTAGTVRDRLKEKFFSEGSQKPDILAVLKVAVAKNGDILWTDETENTLTLHNLSQRLASWFENTEFGERHRAAVKQSAQKSAQ